MVGASNSVRNALSAGKYHCKSIPMGDNAHIKELEDMLQPVEDEIFQIESFNTLLQSEIEDTQHTISCMCNIIMKRIEEQEVKPQRSEHI